MPAVRGDAAGLLPEEGQHTGGPRFAHYEIAADDHGFPVELGRGAMGVTYRAVDTILHCAVALKVIAPEIARNPSARARFLREARAAAGLRHPHVASVFFFGERREDGELFYAMELIEGETLHARVGRAGGLPAETVLEIGAQVADALAAAEARGLMHRDLKPANLMLVAGEGIHVKVIDFGLARAIAQDRTGDPQLTRVDDFVGTPAFASPEHFNPWQEKDARSDFYALGATLWYALTGQPPFAGRTAAEVRERQRAGVLPLSTLRAARVPRRVVQLLRLILSSDPAGRPQTARALGEALKRCRAEIAGTITLPTRWRIAAWTAAIAALLLGAMMVGSHARARHRAAPPLPAPDKSIAVLPFDNLSEGRDNAFFADGVQGEILTDLAKVADLKVISRGSVMQYRSDTPRNLREIAAALGVANVLEGSVQRAGGKVRVSAQLIDARNGTQLWADRYDRDLADVFAIQSDIARSITDQLQARISAREKAAVQERPTSDLAAYDLYLRAKELLDTTQFDNKAREVLPQMIRLLDEAVARDPGFLAALCLLARAHEDTYWFGFDSTPARFALAEEVLTRATRLRPDAEEVHLARALHLYHCHDYAGAWHELDVVARALPNNADIHLLRAYILRRQGQWDESLREHQKGIALNPRGRLALEQLYVSNLVLHRYDEVARLLDYLLTLAPSDAYLRADRSMVDLFARADPRAAYAVLPDLVNKGPEAAEAAVGPAVELTLCTRDVAFGTRTLAAASAREITSRMLGQYFPRTYFEGMFAHLNGDAAKAQSAFQQARNDMERKVAEAPDDSGRLIMLGLIDAALGRKADAIAEGEHSVRVLQQAKDVFETPFCVTLLAAIYANTGEKDKALALLGEVVNKPGGPCYGHLRLHPHWDPLRGDPRFEALVNKAAPPDLQKPVERVTSVD